MHYHDEHNPYEANGEQFDDIEATTFTANETKMLLKAKKVLFIIVK